MKTVVSGLVTEPLITAIARGDRTLRCEVIGLPDGWDDPDGYALDTGEKAEAVGFEGNDLVILFPRALKQGDRVWM